MRERGGQRGWRWEFACTGSALEGLGLSVVPRGRAVPEACGLRLWVECWTAQQFSNLHPQDSHMLRS